MSRFSLSRHVWAPCQLQSNMQQASFAAKYRRYRCHTGLITLLLGMVTLSGCTSHHLQSHASLRDSISTNIQDNGLKLFRYKLTRVNPEANTSGAYVRPRNNKEAKQLAKYKQIGRDNMEAQAELGLANTMAKLQYCRDGYIELSRLIETDRAEIRGECKEGANAEDRRRFPTF